MNKQPLYSKSDHDFHYLHYHLGWCTRRQANILVGLVAAKLKDLILERCKERGWGITEIQIETNYVLISLRVWPSNSPASVVSDLKYYTIPILKDSFPEVFDSLPSGWTRNLFASTEEQLDRENFELFVRAQPRR